MPLSGSFWTLPEASTAGLLDPGRVSQDIVSSRTRVCCPRDSAASCITAQLPRTLHRRAHRPTVTRAGLPLVLVKQTGGSQLALHVLQRSPQQILNTSVMWWEVSSPHWVVSRLGSWRCTCWCDEVVCTFLPPQHIPASDFHTCSLQTVTVQNLVNPSSPAVRIPNSPIFTILIAPLCAPRTSKISSPVSKSHTLNTPSSPAEAR